MSEEKKLTDEEVVKALECCGSNHKENSCEICPLRHVLNCFDTVLHDNALDIIHRLQSDNEKKDKYIEYLQRKLNKTGTTYRRKLC